MTTKYTYALLRFVPDPVKGEFVNIGIIAGSDEEDRWEIRTIERAGRATQLAAATSRGAWSAVMSELGSLQEQLADYSERTEGLRGGGPVDRLGRDWLEQLSASSRSVLQVSPVSVALAESVDDAVETLWPVLIAESTEREQVVRKSKIRGQVATRFRDYYRQLGSTDSVNVEYHVDTRLRLQAGGTDADIDVVAYNGRAARLTQCYSFDVNDLSQLKHDVKAWGWTVRDLRDNGGEVCAHGRSVPVDRDVPVGVAYFLPTSPSEEALSTFDYAKTVFESEGVDATLAKSDQIDTLLPNS